MADWWNGLLVAFGLYSALPLPQVTWKKNTMRYALCFLPLIGVLVGAGELGWLLLARRLGLNSTLCAALAVLLPVALTGGIHLDGFTDTCDALCSYGDREKRLQILKDPHIGAFGVLWLFLLLIVQLGLFAQLYDTPDCARLLLVGYAAARAFGGSLIVTQPCAKDSGLAHLFADSADKRTVARVLLGWKLACAVGALALCGVIVGAAAIVLTALLDVFFKRKCRKIFGGVTGDLCGMCITLCELLALALAVGGAIL